MEPPTSRDPRLDVFASRVETSPHNLVSKAARSELRTRHVPECVALAAMLPNGSQRLLDVGSGGGFPGMILAIMRPDIEVHLLDSTEKKTRFLTGVAAELDVPVTVHRGRAEELAAGPMAGSYDVVTARAVAPLSRLLAWTIPFLRVGGLLYAVKGDRWQEEIEAAEQELRRRGARVVATPDEVQTPAGSVGDVPSDILPRVVIIARDR